MNGPDMRAADVLAIVSHLANTDPAYAETLGLTACGRAFLEGAAKTATATSG